MLRLVTPLGGLYVPKSEMNAVLAAYKLLDVTLRAMREKPNKVHVLTDSHCVMAAARSETGKLNVYLANWRAQAEQFIASWGRGRLYPDCEVLPPLHIAGSSNIADLGTRGLATMDDVGKLSEWQNGPEFLRGDER